MAKMPALALASLLALLSIPAFADPPRCPRAARQPGPVQRSGRQHLAVIAIGRYLQWTRLANLLRDAREIRDLIVKRCDVVLFASSLTYVLMPSVPDLSQGY